jgi:hypothetical protein
MMLFDLFDRDIFYGTSGIVIEASMCLYCFFIYFISLLSSHVEAYFIIVF